MAASSSMNKGLFERLLYEEESTTLDCKREQYRFVKASDEEKSELLKDLLGFANAWRRSEAYILIGVEEVRGDRSRVVGIDATNHLADHSLQQFVNNLTNRPMRFHYEAFGYEDRQVGIIRIDLQPRPIYLKREYGRLEKEKVYIRRGSSTDPSKPASLEEIATMGQTTTSPLAELVVEFAQIDRDDSLGPGIGWDAEFSEMPLEKTIPDFPTPSQQNVYGVSHLVYHTSATWPNRNYFRELAHFEFARRLFRPIRLLIKNVGEVAASDVRCEFDIEVGVGVHVMSHLPKVPTKESSPFTASDLRDIKPAFRRTPGDVTINRNDDRYRVEIECGDLQPGRRIWSDVFYLGKRDSGVLELVGKIYAANLSRPKDFTLRVTVSVTAKAMSIRELTHLPTPPEEDT